MNTRMKKKHYDTTTHRVLGKRFQKGFLFKSENHFTYGALLNCYCEELMTEKAEALVEKMMELKIGMSSMPYNSLMTYYTKIYQPEKVLAIIPEMKASDVMLDLFSYNVWMRSLAAVNDISGVERVIDEMKRDGRVTTI